MSGFDDLDAMIEDWILPSPNRSGSSMTNDFNVASLSIADFSQSGPVFQGPNPAGTVDQNVQHNEANNSNTMSETKTSSRGGLLERIAARAGFNAPRLDTESIRPNNNLLKNERIPSPYFTAPPGLSPTALLESPVFLTNPLFLASPTTGKLSCPPSGNNQDPNLMTDESPDKGKENTYKDYNASSGAFKPTSESVDPFACFDASNKIEHNGGDNHLPEHIHSVGDSVHHSPPLNEPMEDGDPNNGMIPAEEDDGYIWRKYGQKQVKGSEYPRKYYKCIYSNCPVKKKVERTLEGAILEVVYKGGHNHLKPQACRPSAAQLDSGTTSGANDDLIIWSSPMETDNPEATSSPLLSLQHSNGATTFTSQSEPQCDGDMNDDGVTNDNVPLGCDVEEDESEIKRRRIEAYVPEMSETPPRAIREPRVIVQTTSDVDILDDGYRWRKYGQKLVKGNPNPRSYYKCTSNGCNVRKHVERASHDFRLVITTYEGKHNHEVPAPRSTGHGKSNTNSSQAKAAAAAAASNRMQRSEPSQSSGVRLERPSQGQYGFAGQSSSQGFGYGMNQHGLASMELAGLGRNRGKLPVFSVDPYLGQHTTRPVNDMSFMMSNGEPNSEHMTDSGLNSTSNGSSIYHQILNRPPHGPHM